MFNFSVTAVFHWVLIALSCIFVFALCFVPLRIESESLDVATLFDAGHLPLFGALAIAILLAIFVNTKGQLNAAHFAISASLAIFVAALVEILQPLVNRDPTYIDFVNGAIGVLLGLGGVIVFFENRSLLAISSYFIALALGCGIALDPYIDLTKAVSAQQKLFPVLADFEDSSQLKFWGPLEKSEEGRSLIAIRTDFPAAGKSSLKVTLGSSQWPGVVFQPPTQPWTQYKNLMADLYLPQAPLSLTLRVDDDGDCSTLEKRFNRRIELQRGWNQISIPLEEIKRGPKTRELNLNRVRRVLIFSDQTSRGASLFIDNLRLSAD